MTFEINQDQDGLQSKVTNTSAATSLRTKCKEVHEKIESKNVLNCPGISTPVVLLAWALTQAQYHGTKEVIFHSIGLDPQDWPSMKEPSGKWQPCSWSVKLDSGDTVRSSVKGFQDEKSRILNSDAGDECSDTLLVVHDTRGGMHVDRANWNVDDWAQQYACVVVCEIEEDLCEIHVRVSQKRGYADLEPSQIATQLSCTITRMSRHEDDRLADLMGPSSLDMAKILSWNKVLPPAVDSCVHDIVQQRSQEQPNAIAVVGWDGEFTYRELVEWAMQLATQLAERGVRQETLVPLLFEKSRWTTVAMLGVLMAGGAFVTLEPSYPTSRLVDICDVLQAPLIICSSSYKTAGAELNPQVIVLNEEYSGNWRKAPSFVELPAVQPSQALYAVFTSGSTGKPKGVLMEHGAYCTSALAYNREINILPSSRVLQFSSYAFDVGIIEILSTLMAGACVCVLSDSERIDTFAESALALAPTHAFLTPSFARMLSLSDLDSVGLEALILTGEGAQKEDIARYSGRVRLMNAYGPAECSIASVQTDLSLTSQPTNIGYPTGGIFWLVDPGDFGQLSPIGAIGELLIEGPLVARGYLNDADKPSTGFIDPPAWLSDIRCSRPSKVYRTGDLMRQQADGSLLYMGRKDTQVKIHGQRVELGDVESHVRQFFQGTVDVVAEVVTPNASPNSSFLVVFILEERNQEAEFPAALKDTYFAQPTAEFVKKSQDLRNRLRYSLPRYMVPSTIIPLVQMPRTTTGKVNRRLLRTSLSNVSREEKDQYGELTESEKTPPRTKAEGTMRQIWSQVLQRSAESIGINDSFFEVGGDSISAIRVAALARSAGLPVVVSDIFAKPNLSMLTSESSATTPSTPVDLTPFSLFGPGDRERMLEDLQDSGLLHTSVDISDMLPMNSAQLDAIKTYNMQCFLFTYRGPISVDRLRAACEAIWVRHAILRAVFAPFQKSLAQVILSNITVPFQHLQTDQNLDDYCAALCEEERRRPSVRELQTRFVLVSHPNLQEHVFILRLAGVVVDAIAFQRLFRDISTAYLGNYLDGGLDYPSYLYYQRRYRIGDARAFWREYLAGSTITQYPGLIEQSEGGDACWLTPQECPMAMPLVPEGITLATVIKAAWSCSLAELTRNQDVVFAQLVNGRSLPIDNIDQMVGSCVNPIPCRVQVSPAWTVREFLQHVQEQHLQTLRFDYMEMPDIIENCSPWPQGSDFNTFFLHHNIEDVQQLPLGDLQSTKCSQVQDRSAPKCLFVSSYQEGDSLSLTFATSNPLIYERGPALIERFAELVKVFSNDLDKSLALILHYE